MDNASNNQQPIQDLSVRAAKILADLKKASDDFMATSGDLVSDLNQEVGEAEREMDVVDKDLSNAEEGVNDKIDEAILEYLSEEEK